MAASESLELALLHLGEQIRGVGVGGLGGFVLRGARRVEGRIVSAILLRLRACGGGLGLSEESLELSLVHRMSSVIMCVLASVHSKLASVPLAASTGDRD